MSTFSLSYWPGNEYAKERVYINSDFIKGFEIYFMKGADDLDPPRAFCSSGDHRSFPEPYASSKTPAQDIANQALIDNGLDPEHCDWLDLLTQTQ